MDLTDEQWHLLQPLLPAPRPAGGRGRPPLPQRVVLNGVLWKLRYNQPWRAVPSRYGSHEACYQSYNIWKKSGVLNNVLNTLRTDLLQRGKFDFKNCIESGAVYILEKPGKIEYYIRPEYADDWRISTSLIIFNEVARRVKERSGY